MMKPGLTAILTLMLAAAWAGGCGYSLSPSPYGLSAPLTLSLPIASNRSNFKELGPHLTSAVIDRLESSPNIRVREGASARLTLNIRSAHVSGGSWQLEDYTRTPVDSASRVASMTVEAVLEKPGPGGRPATVRNTFSGSRTFLVGSNQSQIELRQRDALEWIINDISQKIGQTMFSDF